MPLGVLAIPMSLVQAGQAEKAETVARSITNDRHQQREARIRVAQALAQAGQAEQAETVARSITTDPVGLGNAMQRTDLRSSRVVWPWIIVGCCP